MAIPVDLFQAVDVGIHPLLLGFSQVPLLGAYSDRPQSCHLSEQLSVVVDSHESALVGLVLLDTDEAVVSGVVLQVLSQVSHHASLPLVVHRTHVQPGTPAANLTHRVLLDSVLLGRVRVHSIVQIRFQRRHQNQIGGALMLVGGFVSSLMASVSQGIRNLIELVKILKRPPIETPLLGFQFLVRNGRVTGVAVGIADLLVHRSSHWRHKGCLLELGIGI